MAASIGFRRASSIKGRCGRHCPVAPRPSGECCLTPFRWTKRLIMAGWFVELNRLTGGRALSVHTGPANPTTSTLRGVMSKHSGGNPYPRPLSSLTPAIHGLVSGAVIGALLGLRDFTQSTRQNQGNYEVLADIERSCGRNRTCSTAGPIERN